MEWGYLHGRIVGGWARPPQKGHPHQMQGSLRVCRTMSATVTTACLCQTPGSHPGWVSRGRLCWERWLMCVDGPHRHAAGTSCSRADGVVMRCGRGLAHAACDDCLLPQPIEFTLGTGSSNPYTDRAATSNLTIICPEQVLIHTRTPPFFLLVVILPTARGGLCYPMQPGLQCITCTGW